MATVFWDFKGVLLVDFLYTRRTVNAAYYCDLLEQVRTVYIYIYIYMHISAKFLCTDRVYRFVWTEKPTHTIKIV